MNTDVGGLGLPSAVVDSYAKGGLRELFPWQAECLSLDGVLNGHNLVYSAPTSAGKTLVAELIALKRTIDTRRKALFILPYISVAREKLLALQKVFRSVGLKVDGYIGASTPTTGLDRWSVAVCTIEKANGLINRLIDDNAFTDIGTVVVDEVHMIGDLSRGHLLELLLTKLMYLSSKQSVERRVQIIAMSATVPNLASLGKWLHARVYRTDFRPIQLSQTLAIGPKLHQPTTMTVISDLPTELKIKDDLDNVIGYCLETILDGNGVLVFCASKAACEKLAESVGRFMRSVLISAESSLKHRLRAVVNADRQREFVDQVRKTAPKMDSLLAKTLLYGVAFHHAGLVIEEREAVERGFRQGAVRMIAATSTLSSGVNLPARRVIVRSPWGHPNRPGPYLSSAVYLQMIGRAGRKGIDDKGESILICKPNEVQRARQLVTSALAPIKSALHDLDSKCPPSNSMKRAVLEAICGGIASDDDSLVAFVNTTLMASQQWTDEGSTLSDNVGFLVKQCVDYLTEKLFINREDGAFSPTQLGTAALVSALGAEDSLAVFADLSQAQRALSLDNELHMLYLVTPLNSFNYWTGSLDWAHFYSLWCQLPANLKRVAALIGVTERYLIGRVQGRLGASDNRQEAIHTRFLSALALHELINEVPLTDVADRYKLNRGALQSMQQQASTYACMVVAFCDRLGWSYLKALLDGFSERLAFGVRRDLTELVRIDGIDGSRARVFHSVGINSAALIATAKVETIVAVLRKAVPFVSDGSKNAWLAQHPDLSDTEAAELLITRSKAIVEEQCRQMGLQMATLSDETVNDSHVSRSDVTDDTNNSSMSSVSSTSSDSSVSHHLSPRVESPHVEENNNADDFPCANQHTSRLTVEPDEMDRLLGEVRRITISPKSSNDERSRRVPAADYTVSDSMLIANADCFNAQRDASATPMLFPELSDDEEESNKENTPQNDSSRDMFDDSTSSVQSSAQSSAPSSTPSSTPSSIPSSIPPPNALLKRVRRRCSTDSPVTARSPSTKSPAIKLSRQLARVDEQSSEFSINDVCQSENHWFAFKIALDKITEAAFDFVVEKRNSINENDGGILIEGGKNVISGITICPTEGLPCFVSFASDASIGNESEQQLFPSCTPCDEISLEERISVVIDFLRSPSRKICWNGQTSARLLVLADSTSSTPETDWSCMRTLAYLADLRAVDGESRPKLADVIRQLLPHDQHLVTRLTKAASGRVGSSLATFVCARTHRRLRALAVASSSKKAVDLEMNAAAVLGRMEATGFGFNRQLCDKWLKEFRRRLQLLETEAHSLAGINFNLDSPSAVANALFARLGLAHPGGTSTAKRHYATNKTVLEQLSKSHRLPAVILEWRQLNNAIDTALAPLSRATDADRRVRGRFDPFTATGRITMYEPNIQTIPKTKFTFADGGCRSIRALFKASEGYSLIMADYSQLELRVLAHLSNDARLLAILNSRDGDVFDSIARQWKSVLGPVERQKVKQVCYGIIYGMGTTKLAEQMGTDVETARKFTNQFYSDFPDVRRWIDETIELCANCGLIRTLLGRSRRLPHIHSKVSAERSRAERQAINSTIQGSAADIFKSALVDVEKVVAANDGRLVMQIHDEVIVEVPSDRLTTVSLQLATAMETCRNDLRVRLFVKLKCGESWDI